MSKTRPSVERLREVLAYDPATGKLTWRISRGSAAAGSIAGSLNGEGYLQAQIDGRYLRCSRVIFAMVTGRWPEAAYAAKAKELFGEFARAS